LGLTLITDAYEIQKYEGNDLIKTVESLKIQLALQNQETLEAKKSLIQEMETNKKYLEKMKDEKTFYEGHKKIMNAKKKTRLIINEVLLVKDILVDSNNK